MVEIFRTANKNLAPELQLSVAKLKQPYLKTALQKATSSPLAAINLESLAYSPKRAAAWALVAIRFV
jgi:hypothetical protein